MPDTNAHSDLLDEFVRQLWSMQLQQSSEQGAALHKPLLMLAAISRLEAGTGERGVFRFSDLEETFSALWPKYGGRSSQPDAALPFFHLSREPFWRLDGIPDGRSSPPPTSTLRSDGVAARIVPDALADLLAKDRAARLHAADALLLRWWPTAAARQLARALSLSRTHRLLIVDPENFDVCVQSGTWGSQTESALKKWRIGDALLFHVTKGGGIRATAVVAGDAYHDDAPLWQDMRGKAYPWRIPFRLAARLESGVATKTVLEPLRPGAAANWFNGFIQSSHSLSDEDAYALLDAFEDLLAAS